MALLIWRFSTLMTLCYTGICLAVTCSAATRRPTFCFCVKDHLGSTRAVVDEAGDVVEAYDYYPFGLQSRSYKEKGDPLTKETFTGKEQVSAPGLNFLKSPV
jgi:hypothetical protein